MAIAFGGSAVPAGNPTTSFTITIPAGVKINDLLILATTNRDATTAPTVTDDDSGGNTWTQRSSAVSKGRLFYKRATANTASKTITASGFTGSCSGVLIFLAGVQTTGDPFHRYTLEENISGNETHASVTPTLNGCYIIGTVHNVSNDNAVTNSAVTDPGAMTEGNEKLSTGGSDCATSVRGRRQITAAATGAFTWTQTDGVTVSQLMALAEDTTQHLAQTQILTEEDTFYVPIISQTIFPGLFADSDTFFTPTISQTIFPGLFTDGDTFFTHEVTQGTGGQTLEPSLFTDDDTFFSPSVIQIVSPSLFTDEDTFHTPTVTTSITLTADLFTDTDSFPSATVTTQNTLTASLYTDVDTFFNPTVEQITGLNPDLFIDADAFFSPTVSTTYTLVPSLYTDIDTFFSPTVSFPGAELFLTAETFTNQNLFFNLVVNRENLPEKSPCRRYSKWFHSCSLGIKRR